MEGRNFRRELKTSRLLVLPPLLGLPGARLRGRATRAPPPVVMLMAPVHHNA